MRLRAEAAARGVRVTAITMSMLIGGMVSVQAADTQSGSGTVISDHGEVLTNAQVIENCSQITVRSSSGDTAAAALIARDENNDLAVIRSASPLSPVAVFRDGSPIRLGEAAVALGYANLTIENVSALTGLSDDSRYLQISAPVQPGNSGGPLLDSSGHLVGIVTAKLNPALVARVTGDIPQNVNFALKAEVARTFLDSKGILYKTAHSNQQLSAADVGDIARPFTVQIECHPNKRSDQRVAGDQKIPGIAQRAVLYEEDTSEPNGRKFDGSAVWRTETASPGSGRPAELAARADIQIPGHVVGTFSLRHNSDQSLPATHTIEIRFSRPPGDGIANIPGILMKEAPQIRGKPLAGLAVKVTDGFFLIGLSAADTDRLHNLQLLKDQEWFDIPIVYNNGHRAILAVEKGPSGARVFTDAFAAWGESGSQ